MGCNLDKLTSFKDNCGFGLIADLKNKSTHKNLKDAIESLSNMMHRGAVAADGKSGDGSGLLLSMPNSFMRKVAQDNGVDLPKNYAVAMVFSKQDSQLDTFAKYCNNNGLKILFSRIVPVNTEVLGKQALVTLPTITQIFVTSNTFVSYTRFDAMLYLTRKECEHALKDCPDFYIPTFSSKVISYKGLLMPINLREFYIDLQDPDFKISFALFHQRFSTNTLPQWRLAQPFRGLAHNGEINSIEANRYNVKIKSETLKSDIFSDDELKRIFPILEDNTSDSASLDNIFEFLVVNGMDIFKVARSLIPAPWQNSPHMDAELRAFYEYTSTCFEAWDGPAAVSMTDGNYIGCLIDRNGLRPAKYVITKDKRFFITSEYGTLKLDNNNIQERGRLQSGEMIGLDIKNGIVLKENDINDYIKNSQNYSKWLVENMVYLQEYIEGTFEDHNDYKINNMIEKQRYYNITYEILDQIIDPMSVDGKEPTGSMGDDTPLACFSSKHRNFTDFFRQKFAQVTNPPIDPYREKNVMSLNTGFGTINNVLEEKNEFAKRVKTTSPIMMKEKMNVLLSFGDITSENYDEFFKNEIFSTVFKNDLKHALEELYKKIKESILTKNTSLIILDDRGLSKKNKIIPMALAIGYVNQNLANDFIKNSVSLIAISGEIYDPHGAAVLIAFGATAIYPYMLYASVLSHCERKKISKKKLSIKIRNTQLSLNGGLMKIISKMGISTIASYRNSSLFDVIGLSDEIVSDCFVHANSDICGLSYDDIEKRLEKSHYDAFVREKNMFPLEMGGIYKYISDGEYHDFSPNVVKTIHNKFATRVEDINNFTQLKEIIENRDKKFIRDFFEIKSDKTKINIQSVESKHDIFKRFSAAAMSCGSISIEAHESIAIAMNKIGGFSNSGEGGEDVSRFNTLKNSKIKQIASGRFGVTPGYLRNADELQIKIAQGAKPGEGGQLPGAKVSAMIATLRHTAEGITLISPPPHHDIYSIEDLSQLIFDLKQINPKAKITVKLVSTIGIGTIAVGVAKAYADKIVISGSDGGTGAAPLTSIKHTGNAWELGLTEAHNALKANNLRDFVHLQTDGGLKSGIDVVKAAMLGAESYAFGTVLLTILGCKILRICHTNKCSVGVATQDEKLREKFTGTVDRLIEYFEFLAQDIREILASLGYNSLEDIIGRSDLLRIIDDDFAKKFDFQNILRKIDGINTCQKNSNDPYDKNELEKNILTQVNSSIKDTSKKITIDSKITNRNRSFGALISGVIASKYGDEGLPLNTINLNLKGIAGQSFGVFLSKGISIYLKGVANDYVGKGMSGGKIIIDCPNQGEYHSGAGNTCLYGATGGKLYVNASVGERFAVRNSGSIAIVEGTGDNACEYMTGGVVVSLGRTGINFGAGMTGGMAFIYDKNREFVDNMNRELVEALRIDTDNEEFERIYLQRLLKDFINETKSENGQNILDNFRSEIRNFWMVKPKQMSVLPLNPDRGD